MTLRTLLDSSTANYPSHPFMRFKRHGSWITRTYSEAEVRVRQMAEILGKDGLRPQTDSVAILLENGPEWIEGYLALSTTGIVAVPMDCRMRAYEATHVLRDSNAVAILTDFARIQLLETILPSLPNIRTVFVIDGAYKPRFPKNVACVDCESERAKLLHQSLTFYDANTPSPGDIASVIYTSGTTGSPKGAMLTHDNFMTNTVALQAGIDMFRQTDDFLVVLPLFHVFSFTTNFVTVLHLGAQMSFVENIKTVAADLRTLKSSVLMSVPLLAEKMYDGIETKIKGDPFGNTLMKLHYAFREVLPFGRLVGMGAIRNLGGKLRCIITGGAPCPIRVLEGFARLGIPIVEGYGLTECSPVVSVTNPRKLKIGTIGKKLPGLDVRVAEPDDQGIGELEVKGPCNMKGYLKNPEATAEVMDGDWLRTGDLVSIDSEGYITIRGRKKSLIVTREGRNIYPEEVEQVLAADPCVAEVVALGYTRGTDKGERVGVIAVPDVAAITAMCGGIEPTWEGIVEFTRKRIVAQSTNLSEYKHPRKIVIQRDPFERTATQKIRRGNYAGTLDEI